VNRLRLALRSPLSIIRIYFFLWFAGSAFISPYLAIFYQGVGLSGFQIGLLSSVGFAVGILAAPRWGHWADRMAAPQRLLQLAIPLSIAGYLILSRQKMFLPIAGIVIVYSLFSAAQEPIAAALAIRSTRNTGTGFGSVRVWGSLGWSVLVWVAGWWIQNTTIRTAFYGFAASMTAGWFVLFLFRPGSPPRPLKNSDLSGSASDASSARHRPIPALLAAVLILWIAVAGVKQFETLYLKELGAGTALIGFTAMLSSLVELPSMFGSDWLTRRFGAHRVLIAGMFLDGLIRGSVVLWPSIPALVVARILIGTSFSLTTVGMVAYVQEYVPHEQQTRAVALYTVVIRNLVYLVINPVCGLIFDKFGAYWLYAIALGGNFLGASILLLAGSPKSGDSTPPSTAVGRLTPE
jgi:PPP family 3-phenylpropionic acid transporter